MTENTAYAVGLHELECGSLDWSRGPAKYLFYNRQPPDLPPIAAMTHQQQQVYLDHAATTPVDPRVVEAMHPFWTDSFGNASSLHTVGRRARVAMEEARELISDILSVEPSQVIFTSGGTEAANMAVATATRAGQDIACGKTEHEAVLKPIEYYERLGGCVRWLPAGRIGQIDAAEPASAEFVAAMYVNNETGAVNDPRRLCGAPSSEIGCYYADCVQALGYYPLNLTELGIDLASFSAHKIGGPKGIGLLYASPKVELLPMSLGGEQEQGRRAGTENVASIVGFAKAIQIADAERVQRSDHVRALRNKLLQLLTESMDGSFLLNSSVEVAFSAPHILNIAFPPVDGRPIDGEMLLLNLDIEGVCVSAGSACTSGSMNPSHVLLAAGLDTDTASASIRFSLSHTTTSADIEFAVDKLSRVYKRMATPRSSSAPPRP